MLNLSSLILLLFLSTPSARRATYVTRAPARDDDISIHALREEGDQRTGITPDEFYLFLSTPSARRATVGDMESNPPANGFLSTPSARRATVTK